jgi:hypothetical protein
MDAGPLFCEAARAGSECCKNPSGEGGLRGGAFRDRTATLVSLYWEPENAAAIDECRRHEAEIAHVRRLLTDGSVEFRPLSNLTAVADVGGRSR